MTSAEPIQSFRELPARQKAEIAALFIRKEYEPDEYVFFEGNDPVQLWFVEQGRIKLLKHSDTGKDVIVTVVSAGTFLGEAALRKGEAYSVTAQAVEPTVMLLFPEETYQHLLQRYPDLSVLIISGLEQRLEEAYETLRSMAVERVERRIARLLLRLAATIGKQTEDKHIMIDMPLTRQEIAEMTGTTVESAIRVMSKLRKQGIIASGNGRILLNEPHALVTIADEL